MKVSRFFAVVLVALCAVSSVMAQEPGMMGGMPGEMMMMGGMGGFQNSVSEAEKGNWITEVYTLPEGGQPFMNLLSAIAGPGATISSSQNLVAVYASPLSHSKIEKFIENLRRQIGEKEESRGLKMELLYLIAKPSKPGLSKEAKEMGLELSDLGFLGDMEWVTVSKSVVAVQAPGETRIESDTLEIEVVLNEVMPKERVSCSINMYDSGYHPKDGAKGTEALEQIPQTKESFETAAEITLGQTTIISATSDRRALVLRLSDAGKPTDVKK